MKQPLQTSTAIPSKLVGFESKGVDMSTISSELRQMEVIEPEKLICLEYRVLLKVKSVENLTSGGVFKPDSAIVKELMSSCSAEIVSMGAEAFSLSDGSPMKNRPQIGDRVVTAKYAGVTARDKDFNLYRFANDKDCVAVIKGEKE